jgi:hypothetical protein
MPLRITKRSFYQNLRGFAISSFNHTVLLPPQPASEVQQHYTLDLFRLLLFLRVLWMLSIDYAANIARTVIRTISTLHPVRNGSFSLVEACPFWSVGAASGRSAAVGAQ